jgi:hypothetical protein
VTSNPKQRAAREPLYDINPETGVSIEIFYADRTLETFGRGGAGWFWWSRRSGSAPEGPATGPYASDQHPRQERSSATKHSGGNSGLGLLVRLPIPGEQVGDFVGGVIWEPCQHVS